jgi:hypothetical protein
MHARAFHTNKNPQGHRSPFRTKTIAVSASRVALFQQLEQLLQCVKEEKRSKLSKQPITHLCTTQQTHKETRRDDQQCRCSFFLLKPGESRKNEIKTLSMFPHIHLEPRGPSEMARNAVLGEKKKKQKKNKKNKKKNYELQSLLRFHP